MKINFIVIFQILIFLAVHCSRQPASVRLQSPNGRIVFELKPENENSALLYSVSVDENILVKKSHLGFVMGDGPLKTFKILSVRTSRVNESWSPVYGERNEMPNRYQSALIKLCTMEEPERFVHLNCRIYDEGIAFRYEFPEQRNWKQLSIKKEQTEFSFTQDHQAWVAYRAQAEYTKIPLSQIQSGCERPLVIRINPALYVAIGEANLVNYARMKFSPHPERENTLVCDLASPVQAELPFDTPWRFIMIGENPGQLLENNYLLLNLSEPNEIKDTSWIRPGKVIREVTLTTQGGIACVDFAAKHNLQYVEFDAGWYGHEYDDSSDATTVTVDPRRSPGPLDLHEVIRYAKERDVGVILYVNRRALEKQLDDVLPLFQEWGVAGVKYGFVRVGPQQWTAWLHEAVRKAAHHKLMIDIHDEVRPTGYSRTYPNLMTQEGIRGDEESPTSEHTLITMFTRMIAGAGDNTICYFAKRVREKMGSHASQLAKAVCLYSPWQFLYWYDRPMDSPRGKGGAGNVEKLITEEPELEFFDHVPTVWDEIKVLEADIGTYGAIARRSGGEWYVGCINGTETRAFAFELDFLAPEQDYVAHIYSDDASVKSRTQVRIDRYRVTSKTIIEEKILPNNGMAMRIVPAEGGDDFTVYK